ncbi:MAG: adenylosuccinate lyase [Candidatus Melainabacteria bacterium HGW-Melainabacteria-1]|nr:MAG: adenylosuccinate lyase [Candidatus Melainabacteria bacterium HGW-Melainabacteria-1]
MSGLLNPLDALSPLDGRYAQDLDPLRACFSERALVSRRIRVELRYLLQLLIQLDQPLAPGLSERLAQLEADPSLVERVKQHEAKTRHDVKALEYALSDVLRADYPEAVNWLHWGLTSEDVTNLAYGLMLSESFNQVMLPALYRLLERLADWIEATPELAMLARTHGQPASPTTVGKEYAVFAERLMREIRHLESLLPVAGKLNGATGNWHLFASFFAGHDWPLFSHRLIASLGLRAESYSTQIVPRESYARVLDACRRIDDILIDLCRDSWQYVSLGYFRLRLRSDGEVGSSTMPHKLNPVLFENAEGNLEIAGSLLTMLSSKLLKSRMQRDLSDSTALRNLGVALGHSLLAWQNLEQGLLQLAPAPERLRADLDGHWEVLAEPLQHALRLQGREVPYDLIRRHTQGLQMSQQDWQQLMLQLNCDLPVSSPAEYTGLAGQLATDLARQLRRFLAERTAGE